MPKAIITKPTLCNKITLACNFYHFRLGYVEPNVTVTINPSTHTIMDLVMFAIALARALMYFVTVTPATLKTRMPITVNIARPSSIGFAANY